MLLEGETLIGVGGEGSKEGTELYALVAVLDVFFEDVGGVWGENGGISEERVESFYLWLEGGPEFIGFSWHLTHLFTWKWSQGVEILTKLFLIVFVLFW